MFQTFNSKSKYTSILNNSVCVFKPSNLNTFK